MSPKLIVAGFAVLLGAVLTFKNSPGQTKTQDDSDATTVSPPTRSMPSKNVSSVAANVAPGTLQQVKQAQVPSGPRSTLSSESCQLLVNQAGNKNPALTQNNLNLCLQFLNSTRFTHNGKSARSCLKDLNASSQQRSECLEIVRAFHLTKNVLESTPQQWGQLDNQSLKTAMKTLLENYSDSQAEKFDELVQYMSKRLPNDGMVAKAALVPVKANTRGELIDHIRQNLDKASRLNPNDPEILGAEMFLAVTTGEKNVLQHLEEFNRANPDSGLGLVYAAPCYHLQGRTDLARAAILAARKDRNRNTRALVKLAEDALDGKSDEVGVLAIGGAEIKIQAANLDKWVRCRQ